MAGANEYRRRRQKMLTYYPDVAAAGNLADALIGAFARMSSSLNAYSAVSPDEPIWSPFSDHPQAPGTTVPEYARVSAKSKTCQVIIGHCLEPLGAFDLGFFAGGSRTGLGRDLGHIVTGRFDTTTFIVRRVLEQDAGIAELAHKLGVSYRAPPDLSTPAMAEAANRAIKRVRQKLADTERPKTEERGAGIDRPHD
jgi:hypothetical protein